MKGRDPSDYQGVDGRIGRIILKFIFIIWDSKCWIGLNWHRTAAGSFEAGNKPFGSIKGGGIF
jgi:hypothetical protein